MKVTSRAKDEILRYTEALRGFNRGQLHLGRQALQLGDLTSEQVKRGLTERLKYAINNARANHLRIPARLFEMAEQALADAKVIRLGRPGGEKLVVGEINGNPVVMSKDLRDVLEATKD